MSVAFESQVTLHAVWLHLACWCLSILYNLMIFLDGFYRGRYNLTCKRSFWCGDGGGGWGLCWSLVHYPATFQDWHARIPRNIIYITFMHVAHGFIKSFLHCIESIQLITSCKRCWSNGYIDGSGLDLVDCTVVEHPFINSL